MGAPCNRYFRTCEVVRKVGDINCQLVNAPPLSALPVHDVQFAR